MGKIIKFARGSHDIEGVMEFADDAALSTLRVVPELLPIILGYKNMEMVGTALFKDAPPTLKENGKFPAFGKEAWKQFDASRGLRGQTQHMEAVNTSVEFNLTEYSLGFMIDDRELEEFAMGKDALMTIRTQMVNNALDVREEILAATAATLTTNYPAAASGAAYDWAGAGNPIKDLYAQKETVRQQIGRDANTVVFDPLAWRLFRNNAAVLSYLTRSVTNGVQVSIVTQDLAAAALEVDVVRVGKMVKTNDAGTVADVWAVNQSGNVVLAYTSTGLNEPTFGFRFQKAGYPRAVSYRWERNHSDIYEVQRILQYGKGLQDSNADFLAGQLVYSLA